MKKQILIVEDEFVVANDLAIMLEASGYEVTGIAASFDAALEKIAKAPPDIVLLDIQLQGALSGIDLARRLKTMNIAFVYISANSDQVTMQQARATEPYGFLVKPVRSKDLMVTLDIATYRHEHGLESFLFRKDRLRGELIHLIEGSEKSDILFGLAERLQTVVPFDLLCFAYTTHAAGHQFAGVYRSGFEEYQSIDKPGLLHIVAMRESEIDPVLASVLPTPEMRRFAGVQYRQFLETDALGAMLDRCYGFGGVIRGAIELPALVNCKMYLFSRQGDKLDDRHVSVPEGMQNLIGKLLIGSSQSEKKDPRRGQGVGCKSAGGCEVIPSNFKKFIGKSRSIAHCLDLVAQVAPLDTSVLITGESGTGKELFAELIHELSPRSRQPFIKINCAALPYTLIESELFGYEKGAFTGANSTRMGKFEAASGGTIFLDEIGEISMDVQVKLLRVLQEKQVQRVGSHKTIATDVRIIAATNRDLETAVAEHRFRLDLYFRLNVFPIQLPPLRHRKEDIPLLAAHLAQQIAHRMGRDFHGFTDEMLLFLQQYPWPGNVREMENVIERALIICGPNKAMNLPQSLAGIGTSIHAPHSASVYATLDEMKARQILQEREMIQAALRETRGKVRGPGGAAEKLDIKPTTLESKLSRLGIRKNDYK